MFYKLPTFSQIGHIIEEVIWHWLWYVQIFTFKKVYDQIYRQLIENYQKEIFQPNFYGKIFKISL